MGQQQTTATQPLAHSTSTVLSDVTSCNSPLDDLIWFHIMQFLDGRTILQKCVLINHQIYSICNQPSTIISLCDVIMTKQRLPCLKELKCKISEIRSVGLLSFRDLLWCRADWSALVTLDVKNMQVEMADLCAARCDGLRVLSVGRLLVAEELAAKLFTKLKVLKVSMVDKLLVNMWNALNFPSLSYFKIRGDEFVNTILHCENPPNLTRLNFKCSI